MPTSQTPHENNYDLIVVGGGASGIFCAINFAHLIRHPSLKRGASILVLEKSSDFLAKVKISGGGRCNVTHAQFDRKEFCRNYPRGERPLISPMQVFSAEETLKWFGQRGVKLVKEADGRMFPSSNSSDEIIECFLKECHKHDIRLLPKQNVKSVIPLKEGTGFEVKTKEKTFYAKQTLIATGSSSLGHRLAQELGHSITELAPSLFSFKIPAELIKNLAGTSFQNIHVKLQIESKRFEQTGPALITHHGLSGPAILKLSAWAAREMKNSNYRAKLFVNWMGKIKEEEAAQILRQSLQSTGSKLLKNNPLEGMTRNFWQSLLAQAQIPESATCANLGAKNFNRLLQLLIATQLEVQGQNRFKEEFVECGGVKLSEIELKTMQSKLHHGLFFTGEILDIDGVTGGFNFQNAWTGGYLAAQQMVNNASSEQS